jgi:hypothetical protein
MIDYLYTYQNKIVSPSSGVSLGGSSVPPMTLRFQFIDESADFDPTQQTWYYLSDGTWTHVEGSVWDFYYPHEYWTIPYHNTAYHSIFGGTSTGTTFRSGPLNQVSFKIINANLDVVTGCPRLFWGCEKMKSICLFDTSKLQSVQSMFEDTVSISYLPDFDFSSVTNELSGFKQFIYLKRANSSNPGLLAIPNLTLPSSGPISFDGMFSGCKYASSGLLNMYNKMNDISPITHNSTFTNCGTLTDNGKLERKFIPKSFGGDLV